MENSYKYQEILILSYFKEHISDSSFIELSQILGLSFSVLNSIVASCCNNGLLEYNSNNLLSITKNGEQLLSKENAQNLSIKNNEIHASIVTKEPISIEEIYIPQGFTNKI